LAHRAALEGVPAPINVGHILMRPSTTSMIRSQRIIADDQETGAVFPVHLAHEVKHAIGRFRVEIAWLVGENPAPSDRPPELARRR
jgi:hypothetical protein